MRRSCLFYAAIAGMLLSSACTHIETRPDYSTIGFGEAVTGIPYALPALRYNLAVSSSIAACPTELALGRRRFSDGAFSLATKVEPTATYVPGERYLANYDALTSPFKTTSFGLETYANGVLKSINVSAEDQSGPLIKDAVSIGLSVAGLAGGAIPMPRSPTFYESTPVDLEKAIDDLLKGSPTNTIGCKASTVEALQARVKTAKALKAETASLEQATKAVATWTAVNSSRRANRADLLELKKALEVQIAAQARFDAAKEEADKAKAGLAMSAALSWPTQIIVFPSKHADVPEVVIVADRDVQVFADLVGASSIRIVTQDHFATWWNKLSGINRRAFVRQYAAVAKHYGAMADSDLKVTETANPIDCATDSPLKCLQKQLSFSGSLELRDRPAEAPEKLPISASTSHQGILVRTAQKADFILCPAAIPNCGRKDQIVYETGVSAPQFGQLRLLPFKNRMFEAAQLSLSLREDGSLEKFEYKRTKAIAGEAAAALKDAIGQYEAFHEKQEKKATDALAAARAEEIAGIDHQIAVLTKQAQLLKLKNPEGPTAQQAIIDETTQINAEVALLNAKLAKLKAEAALASGGTAD